MSTEIAPPAKTVRSVAEISFAAPSIAPPAINTISPPLLAPRGAFISTTPVPENASEESDVKALRSVMVEIAVALADNIRSVTPPKLEFVLTFMPRGLTNMRSTESAATTEPENVLAFEPATRFKTVEPAPKAS